MGPVFQQEVQVLQCVAEGANFNNLNINYVHEYSHVPLHISKSDFSSAKFIGANLSHVFFEESDFTGADFTNANLNGADFEGCLVSVEQLEQAKDICNLTLPDGDTVVARYIDGAIKMCKGYKIGDENKKFRTAV